MLRQREGDRRVPHDSKRWPLNSTIWKQTQEDLLQPCSKRKVSSHSHLGGSATRVVHASSCDRPAADSKCSPSSLQVSHA